MLGRSSFVFRLGSIVNFVFSFFTQPVKTLTNPVRSSESCKIAYFRDFFEKSLGVLFNANYLNVLHVHMKVENYVKE